MYYLPLQTLPDPEGTTKVIFLWSLMRTIFLTVAPFPVSHTVLLWTWGKGELS